MLAIRLSLGISLLLPVACFAADQPGPSLHEKARLGAEALASVEGQQKRAVMDAWRVTLEPVNTTVVVGEPIWFRWTVTCVGLPGSSGVATLGMRRLPIREGFDELPPLGNDKVADAHSLSILKEPFMRGEVRNGLSYALTLLVPRNRDRTGTYQLQVCDPLWFDCDYGVAIQSNTITVNVAKPDGTNAEALAWAGSQAAMAGLMGTGRLLNDARANLDGPAEPDGPPFGRKLKMQAQFLRMFPTSAYAPYVLIHMLQLYRQGYDAKPVRKKDANGVPLGPPIFSPNYGETMRLAAQFTERYRDHPLADEAAFLHAWGLAHTGRRGDALAELARFRKNFPTSHLLHAIDGIERGYHDGLPDEKIEWHYETRWFENP